MAGKLENKVSLITGAASGIGAASAKLFSREGAKVIVADILEKEGQKVVEDIRLAGGEAVFVKCDVSKSEDVRQAIKKSVELYGKLNVVFNNAGIEGPETEFINYPESDFERVIKVNLKGVFLGIKYALPALIKSGGGSIINNASVAGIVGFHGLSAYTASKGGVIQLTRTAALEYARQGIRINAVAPGIIKTSMVDRLLKENPPGHNAFVAMEPVGRFGEPEEVARLAIFLASDESLFITGAVYVIDGGLTVQ